MLIKLDPGFYKNEQTGEIIVVPFCSKCLRDDFDDVIVDSRYSLGIYAGRYCQGCWETSGYRKEGKSGYDFLDAGENYDPSEY